MKVTRARVSRRGLHSQVALLAAAAVSVVAPAVGAQERVTPPVPREQPSPESPKVRFGPTEVPIEGWVKVRYTVKADGTTADVRVVDSLPPGKIQAKDTLAAVEKWRFTPAMDGGQPIEWYNRESTVVFDDPNISAQPSPLFSAAYRAATALLQEQKFDKAKDANDRLLAMSTMGLHEIGLAETQAAVVNMGLSDPTSAYNAIRRATDPAAVTLADDELRQALQIRFAIEVTLGRVAEALDTFARLGKFPTPPDEKMAAQAKAIAEALQTDAAIRIDGRVDQDPWAHTPTRRTFTLANIEGEVRELRLECDRRTQVIPYAANVDWTLPPSWGACTIFVVAKKNTAFKLFEFK